MKRNKNVVINIPSDGLEAAVITDENAEASLYAENVERYLSEFLEDTSAGRIFFNVCYKRSIVHSDTADTYLYDIQRDEQGIPVFDECGKVIKEVLKSCNQSPLNGKYRAMLERNIDIVEMAVKETQKYGAESWFSVRMNDHHYPDDRAFNSSIGYDRAEELGVNGSRVYLDFTKLPVRNYYKSYIKELCENYDIDGIELDFLRSCPVMSAVTTKNIEKMNEFVRELRMITRACNKEIKLAVRVYPTEEMNLKFGLDAAGWVSEGLVDVLTAENWYIPTYYSIPVEKWRESIDARNTENHPYTLLCGTDWAVECDATKYIGRDMWLSLEQFKGFVSGAYSGGADGIYIFNHFNTDDDRRIENNRGLFTCYIDENGIKTEKRVLKDKINAADSKEAAENGMRTYVNTYVENNPYPVTVTKNEGFSFCLNVGSKAEKHVVVVGIDEHESTKPLVVKVNSAESVQIEDVPKEKDFVFEKSSTEWTFVNHVSEVACRVMQFAVDKAAVNDGFNSFEIVAKDSAVTIRWIEIRCE